MVTLPTADTNRSTLTQPYRSIMFSFSATTVIARTIADISERFTWQISLATSSTSTGRPNPGRGLVSPASPCRRLDDTHGGIAVHYHPNCLFANFAGSRNPLRGPRDCIESKAGSFGDRTCPNEHALAATSTRLKAG